MPIFEYCCEECGKKFEKLIYRDSEEAELVCPECGKQHLHRELSTFAAHTSGAVADNAPRCPSSGRTCPTPGACGMN